MARKERPEIELYLYSMNQEFPVKKGHASFLKRNAEVLQDADGKLISKHQSVEQVFNENIGDVAGDWPGQWISNKWIQDYTKSPSWSTGINFHEDVMRHLIMRREDFGGIVLDPTHDRVFKVNTAGYELLKDMVATVHKLGVKGLLTSKTYQQAELEPFVAFMRGAGLWPSK